MQSVMLPDPRVFQNNSSESNREVIEPALEAVHHYLAAPTQEEKERYAQSILDDLNASCAHNHLPSPEEWANAAPSAESARVLRRLIHVWEALPPADGVLGLRFFALPLIIVAAAERPLKIRSVLGQREKVEALLREHHVLGDAEQWGISNTLCSAEAISGEAWGFWMQQQAKGLEGGVESLQRIAPSDVVITVANQEQVFLRFLVGAVVVSSKTAWQSGAVIESWGMAMTECLSQQMAMPGVTVLALPRTPKSLASAVQEGRRLQREVSLQLFIGNAVRDCRSKYGEPSVVLSAHTLEDGSGEVRISISSEFSAKDAQGFRCPLFPDERVVDVQRAIETLLVDCKVQGVRVLQNIYADKELETGLTLLFKPEAIPDEELFG